MSSYIRYSSKGPELLIDMVDQVAEVLAVSGGLPAATATTLAVAITNKMAEAWGGQFVYFPKGTWNGGSLTCFELEERDWKIYQEYDGTNRKAVCAKYAISPSRLHQIIISVRLARRGGPSSPPTA
jgi:Mor family transcriptional regulator